MVNHGDTVGVGGFTLSRTQTALVHELIRQEKRDLTVVGVNISFQLDLLVAAGCVRRVEHGASSIERFGLTYNLRRAVEQGEVESEDYTHLAMASRFLAGSLGIPFIPVRGIQGTDIANYRAAPDKLAVIDNPFSATEAQIVVVPACRPEVAILHVQKADRMGNLRAEGAVFHERELARAAETVIVTCEELVEPDFFFGEPDRTTISFVHVDAVVPCPWGAYPTSCYGYYDYDSRHLEQYQAAARAPDKFKRYLADNVYNTDYNSFLQANLDEDTRHQLQQSMQEISATPNSH